MLTALTLAALVAAGSPAASDAAASPSPTPYKPLPILGAGAMPWGPLSLAGVGIGDAADSVRARLGEPYLANAKPEITVWTYQMDDRHVDLSVFMHRSRVTSVSVALTGGAKRSTFADPFGMHLGDGVDSLMSIHGQTIDVAENRDGYPVGPGFEWEYQFDHGIVASILLTANIPINGQLPTPAAAPPGHDGSSLDKAIVFKAKSSVQEQLFEDMFLAQWCDGKGTWDVTNRALLADPTTHTQLVVYAATCLSTQRAAKFYFKRSGAAAR